MKDTEVAQGELDVALCFAVVPVLIGAIFLGSSRGEVTSGELTYFLLLALAGGAIGGAKLPSVVGHRWKGLVAGALAGAGAIFAVHLYSAWSSVPGSLSSLELALTVSAGAAPGYALHRFFERNATTSTPSRASGSPRDRKGSPWDEDRSGRAPRPS